MHSEFLNAWISVLNEESDRNKELKKQGKNTTMIFSSLLSWLPVEMVVMTKNIQHSHIENSLSYASPCIFDDVDIDDDVDDTNFKHLVLRITS